MTSIVIVGYVEGLIEQLEKALAGTDHELHTADAFAAVEVVETVHPEMAFIAGRTPGIGSLELLHLLKEVAPDLEIVLITDAGSETQALPAMQLGAADVLPWPASAEWLHTIWRRAREKIWMRRKLSEAVEEIRTRQDFEHKLIHTSIDGIIANDHKGRIILFNEGAHRIYGYTPEEALAGVHVTSLYATPDEARLIKKNIYSDQYGGAGRLINYPTHALTKDGRLVPILLSATLVHEGDGEVATVGYFKDLTGLKRHSLDCSTCVMACTDFASAVDLRRHSLRLSALDQAVSEMRFGTPNTLQGIELGGYLVNQGLSTGDLPRIGKGWAMVRRNLERIERLLLSLLDQALPPSGVSRPSALNKVVEEVCENLSETAREHQIRLETDLAPDLLDVAIAPRPLHGCVTHLVANALEAVTPDAPGRVVSVRTSRADFGRISLEVTDTGSGMTAEVQQEIFEPFFTTKGKRRAGLGLAMVRRVITAHGGTIAVESHPGRGSTFTVVLPAAPWGGDWVTG
jgi:PAS domain S-box-containing protein